MLVGIECDVDCEGCESSLLLDKLDEVGDKIIARVRIWIASDVRHCPLLGVGCERASFGSCLLAYSVR